MLIAKLNQTLFRGENDVDISIRVWIMTALISQLHHYHGLSLVSNENRGFVQRLSKQSQTLILWHNFANISHHELPAFVFIDAALCREILSQL